MTSEINKLIGLTEALSSDMEAILRTARRGALRTEEKHQLSLLARTCRKRLRQLDKLATKMENDEHGPYQQAYHQALVDLNRRHRQALDELIQTGGR